MTKNQLKLFINKIVSYEKFYGKRERGLIYEILRCQLTCRKFLGIVKGVEEQRTDKELIKFFMYTNAIWNCIFTFRFDVISNFITKIWKPSFVSPSGSMYWYTKQGCFRLANHWNTVASCNWKLEGEHESYLGKRVYSLAYCAWEDFEFQKEEERNAYYIIREASKEMIESFEDEYLIDYDDRGFMVINAPYSVFAKKLNYTDELC